MTGRPLAGLLLALLTAGSLLADDPKLPDVKTYDKLVVDSLRDVHNKGADLFNESKDFIGAYRLYQGALLTVHPLLAYRPAAQKLITDGIAAAEKETNITQKAFKLHETIEAVRALLKTASDPAAKPEGTKKTTDTKPTEPTETKKPTDTKPTQLYELAPQPREKKKPDDSSKPTPISTSIPSNGKGLTGKVILRGQPLTAAEVTVVSLDQNKPQVFTAVVQADGSYTFTQPLPPGKYVAIVTAKVVPDKYQTTTTSGLTIEVKPGSSNFDIDLK
jgi:hypothetical protein